MSPIKALLFPHVHGEGLADCLVSVLIWQVMMVATMAPVVAPWVMGLARVTRQRGRRSRAGAAAGFLSGYFTIWLGFSIAASAAQQLLTRSGLLDAELAASASLGGLVLGAAGLFQFTGLKRACLAHCRNPLSFFLGRWRNGPIGEFRMGMGHGLYCVGCCWALMATSFALGVMNVAWMALLTIVISAEQLAPGADRVSRAAGLVLGCWGLWLLLV